MRFVLARSQHSEAVAIFNAEGTLPFGASKRLSALHPVRDVQRPLGQLRERTSPEFSGNDRFREPRTIGLMTEIRAQSCRWSSIAALSPTPENPLDFSGTASIGGVSKLRFGYGDRCPDWLGRRGFGWCGQRGAGPQWRTAR